MRGVPSTSEAAATGRLGLDATSGEGAGSSDRFTDVEDARRSNAAYCELIRRICGALVPAGCRVLEIGCGNGDLLASVRPSEGVGIDVSARMVESARRRHPDPSLRFEHVTGESMSLNATFDYVVLSDVALYADDLVGLLGKVAEHSHRRTRVVINAPNSARRPVHVLAERIGVNGSGAIRSVLSTGDLRDVLELTGFEVLSSTTRILVPTRRPVLAFCPNAFVAGLWPFTRLGVSSWIVARPRARPLGDVTVSVVCPCRNEAGHVRDVVKRLPPLGTATELVFVEGGSTDGTRAEIERQIELHPTRDIRLLAQPGSGKNDAVRTGFAAAKHEVLMVLDGDLTVSPEDLPRFYRTLVSGDGELVNGSRLVYDMEPGAMRFLNKLANKAFPVLFRAIAGVSVADMLCGTKALHRSDYEAIATRRADFGDLDPFGDFDLLLGAARLNLKIVDVPVRYQARRYGHTNILRFRHGLLLLRMCLSAYWTFRAEMVRPPHPVSDAQGR